MARKKAKAKIDPDSFEGRAIKSGSKLARFEADFIECAMLAVIAEQLVEQEPDPITRAIRRKTLEAFQSLGGRKSDLVELKAEEPEQGELKEVKKA